MAKYNASMFDSIRQSLQQKPETSSTRDFLKLEVGKTYVVRLLPFVEDLDRTFYHYYSHAWTSVATNQFISVLCPTTWKDRCPIDEYRFKVYRDGTDQEKENSKMLRRNENWLVNVYVITDPTNPENEGKVKTLRYGKQLFKIINEATNGDDVKDVGSRAFDLSEEGCSLRIKVEKNEGGYATYVSSKFLPKGEIPGMTESKADEIYSSVKPLDKVYEAKSYEDIKSILDTHYFGKQSSSSNKPQQNNTPTTASNKVVEAVKEDTSDINDTDLDLTAEERKMQEILNNL
jgi:hypothetical protein